MKRKIKAVGLVLGFYGVVSLVAVGILSIPESFIEKHGTNIMLGGFFLLGSYMCYKAALDLLEFREEEKKRKESNRDNTESGVATASIYPSSESQPKSKKRKK